MVRGVSEKITRPHTEMLPALTPLRGLAALWVVLYHYCVIYLSNLPRGKVFPVLGGGYLAVDLFFLLSGFVMTHVYRDTLARDPKAHARQFFSARIARLYPLHLFVLGLFVAAALAFAAVRSIAAGDFSVMPLAGARSLTALAANLFLLQGFSAETLSWNYPTWSITFEVVGYVLFPLALPLIVRTSGRGKRRLAVVLVAMLAGLAWLTGGNFNQWSGAGALARCLPEFILGMLLYSAYQQDRLRALLGRDRVIVACALLILVLLAVNAPAPAIIVLFPILMLAAVSNTGVFAKLINRPALIRLGEISYSLYLVHGFVQYLASRLYFHPDVRAALSPPQSLALALFMAGVSLLFANLTYDAVEESGRRYLRALLGVQKRPAATAQQRYRSDRFQQV